MLEAVGCEEPCQDIPSFLGHLEGAGGRIFSSSHAQGWGWHPAAEAGGPFAHLMQALQALSLIPSSLIPKNTDVVGRVGLLQELPLPGGTAYLVAQSQPRPYHQPQSSPKPFLSPPSSLRGLLVRLDREVSHLAALAAGQRLTEDIWDDLGKML